MRTFLPIKSLRILSGFFILALCFVVSLGYSQELPGLILKQQNFQVQEKSSRKPQEIPGFHLPKNLSTKEILNSGNAFRVFQLQANGFPMYNAFLLSRQNANGIGIETFIPEEIFEKIAPADFKSEKTSDLQYIFNGQFWELMELKSVTTPAPPSAALIFTDASGQERFREDWLLRFSDSSVRARVFRPDPVSKLRIPYGGQLRDRGDSTYALLRQAMDTVQIRLRFSADSFFLENSKFRFGEFSPPQKPLAKSSSPDSFLFDRNQSGFEEVNAFYHLNRFRQFIDSLGFTSLANYPLKVDAHGMDGADQSAYSPLQDILAYGDGNVDDAEDAAVIVHEYGHVLCQSAIPFGNSGQERRAIEEGLCDYLAGSYLRSFSDYLPNRIFRWDGNNEFWAGRSLVSSKMYPNDLSGGIYADGEIFCSVLTKIEESRGRAVTHQLLLSALPGLIPNLNMPKAARLLLAADTAIFQGQNSVAIRQHFIERGIDPDLVIVGIQPGKLESGSFSFYQAEGKVVFKNPLKHPITIQIYDAFGRVYLDINTEKGKENIHLPLEGLSSGIYFLRVENKVFRFPVQLPR